MRKSNGLLFAGVAVLQCALLTACIIIPIPLTEKPSSPPARPVQSDSMTPEEARLLEAHNGYCAEVGDPPLVWSSELALRSREWAKHLADDVHTLKHSQRAGVGENLAMWTTAYRTPTEMISAWASEKTDFVHDVFRHVSQNGDWVVVGHYTQMVWKDTTQMGCGMAAGGGYEYLVCEYSPQGNVMGETVY